jgi:hypothetical protein
MSLVEDRAGEIGDQGGARSAAGVAEGTSVFPAECATDAETLLITEKRFVKIEHREIR